MEVAIGIDTHKGSLAAAAVDGLGRVLGVLEFTNDPTGHRSLVRWVREQAEPRRIGIEGSLSYGAAVTRTLLEGAEDVREVAPSLTHLERRRRAKGKSDSVDAVAIARVVAADETLASARRAALLFDLKLLVDYRDQLVRARTQVSNRVHADMMVIRPGYEKVVPNLRARRHVMRTRSLICRDRSVQAELVRRRLGEILRLEGAIAEADRSIVDKLEEADTTLIQIPGVGPFIAAKILGEVGEISRIRSKASFASLSGTAPVVASSGQTHRHRLNRRGNRQLNWALHYIALVQSRTTPEAKVYLARQREAGKSHKEAMRCLKRHLSNVVYRHLLIDSRRLEQAA
ncbi:MAG: IS110 family transposase [Gaiellales bacterium]